jgi:hypothetical protein
VLYFHRYINFCCSSNSHSILPLLTGKTITARINDALIFLTMKILTCENWHGCSFTSTIMSKQCCNLPIVNI